jgi:hypothetical protein
MKKVILFALLGLSLVFNSYGQLSYEQSRRIDSVKVVERQFAFDKKAMLFNSQTSSNVLLKNYSEHLIAREIFMGVGTVFTLLSLNMSANMNKNSPNYKSSGKDAANALAFFGGACFITSYTIHLSSLGNLRKYAIKRHKEELSITK